MRVYLAVVVVLMVVVAAALWARSASVKLPFALPSVARATQRASAAKTAAENSHATALAAANAAFTYVAQLPGPVGTSNVVTSCPIGFTSEWGTQCALPQSEAAAACNADPTCAGYLIYVNDGVPVALLTREWATPFADVTGESSTASSAVYYRKM